MLAPGALITSIVDADHDPADDAQLWRLTFNVTHGALPATRSLPRLRLRLTRRAT